MNEPMIKLQAQVFAHEYLLQRLYMFTYAGAKMTPQQIRQSHENMRVMIRTQDWPSSDPGAVALTSGAIEDAIGDFLGGLESMLEEQGLLPEA